MARAKKKPKRAPVKAKRAPAKAKRAPAKARMATSNRKLRAEVSKLRRELATVKAKAKQPQSRSKRITHHEKKRAAKKHAVRPVATKSIRPTKKKRVVPPAFISPELRDLFSRQSAVWDGSYSEPGDGTWSGQIRVPASNRSYENRLIALEDALRRAVKEQAGHAWIRAGVQFTQPAGFGMKAYDKLKGISIAMTHWRMGEFVALQFVGAMSIADNLKEAGAKIVGLLFELHFGPRPTVWDYVN
jgi:hypothetical protein